MARAEAVCKAIPFHTPQIAVRATPHALRNCQAWWHTHAFSPGTPEVEASLVFPFSLPSAPWAGI